MKLLVVILALSFSLIVRAQPVETRGAEVIEATPLSAFSERSGLWPGFEARDTAIESRTLSDSLNSTPGIQSRTTGSPTTSIRGSASADRVLKMLEGIPLNLGDGIGASNLFLPEETIGSTRIFKGPASVFYGSSAMAGAIDHRLEKHTTRAARISYFDQGFGVGENDYFLAAPVGGSQLTGYYSNNPGRYPYSSRSSSGVRSRNASETTRATYASEFQFSSFSVKPILLLAKSVSESPGSTLSPAASTSSYDGSLAGVEVSYALANQGQLTARLSDVRQWGLFDRGTSSESNSFVSRSMLSLDAKLALNSNFTSRTFVDLRGDELRASYLGSNSLNETDIELGQGFEFNFAGAMSLTPVMRYRPADGVLVKAASLAHADNLSRQWLSFSEGYRRPSLSDLRSNTSYFRGNPDLKPEKSRSLEIGAESGSPEDGLWISSSLYATAYDDLIDSTPLTASLSTKRNTGRASVNGLEVSLRDSFRRSSHGFVFQIGASFMDGKNDDTGEALRLSPRSQIAISVAHRNRHAQHSVVWTQWSSIYDRDPATGTLVELAPWSTVDINVKSVDFANWEFKTGILNIFDRPREMTLGYPEPQRQIYASVLRRF